MGPSGQTKKGLRAPDPRRPEVKSRIAILRTFGNAGYGALRPKDKKRSEGSRSKASGGEAVLLYCEPPATRDMGPSGLFLGYDA
jgi:hypothetical protein